MSLRNFLKSLHYKECRPLQSFDNKTPAEVRIAATDDKRETSEEIEKWATFFRTILGRPGTAISLWTLQLTTFI